MKKLALTVVLVSCCGLWVAAVGSARSRAGAVRIGVSIRSWPDGVFGYVNGSKACANGRRVVVFNQRGSGPARPIATVRTKRNEVGYIWLLKTRARGTFDAQVLPKAGCASAMSSGLDTPLKGAGNERCSNSDPACTLVIHLDTPLCPSFNDAFGACAGSTPTANAGWGVPGFNPTRLQAANFNWRGARSRNVSYGAVAGIPLATIEGTVPGPGSPDYTVREAFSLLKPKDRYYTPDRPGAKAGTEGGPLYLNFSAGRTGADIYIWGTLLRR